jgi:cytochrome P450
LLTCTSLVYPDWPWQKLYDPFAKHGDTFVTASPTGVLIWTAEPEAIHQITQRREAFPKPLESYKVLDIYGRNVISTEGTDWKMHRKVTSPGFNEKNNVLVFKESVAQTQGMLRKWMGPDDKGNHTLTEVPMDSMRVTLHIISRIGFGVGLLWPQEEPSENDKKASLNYSSHQPTEGFTMSFEDALSKLLENLLWVLLFPDWLLSESDPLSLIMRLLIYSRTYPHQKSQRSTRIIHKLGSIYEGDL